MALREPLDRYFGADVETGRFGCPLPGHSGTAQLNTLPVDEDAYQDLRLLCCRGLWRSLGLVRAAQAYGDDGRRSNVEIATWLRRLLYDAGCLEPIPISLPDLPSETRAHVRIARAGFELLVGLRWLDGEHQPLPFTVRFCRAWCGLTQRPAQLAIKELQRLGVVEQVGQFGAGRRRMPLYLPGNGQRIRAAREDDR